MSAPTLVEGLRDTAKFLHAGGNTNAIWCVRAALRIETLEAGIREACDLLAERIHGNPARSAGHNARVRLESTLASPDVSAPMRAPSRHPSIQAMIDACKAKGLGDAADYIVELEDLLNYGRGRSATWRGIAAAMGYEPLAHLDVRPTEPWILDRIARYRAEVAAEEIALTIERCAVAAEATKRTGWEWVRDSLWANVLKRAGENVRALAKTADKQ
jgi:hypothetical protein